MYICLCKGITDAMVQQAIADGCDSHGKLKNKLDVCRQCCKCKDAIRNELKRADKA